MKFNVTKYYIFFLLSSFLVVGCKKDRLKDSKDVLIGKWNWQYSYHNYGWCNFVSYAYNPQVHYDTLNIDTESNTYSVEFLKKGKIEFYKNGALEDKKRLVFSYFEEISPSEYHFYVKLNNKSDESMAGSLINDTLYFDYPFQPDSPTCETYLNVFTRE